MTDCDCQACEDLERLSIVVDRIRDLHYPTHDEIWEVDVCDDCQLPWPCMTIKIMNGEA